MLQPQDLASYTVGPGQGVSLCSCGAHALTSIPEFCLLSWGLGVKGRTMRLRFIHHQPWLLYSVNISTGTAASFSLWCPSLL